MEWDKPFFLFQRNRSSCGKAHCTQLLLVRVDSAPGQTASIRQSRAEKAWNPWALDPPFQLIWAICHT